MNLLRSKKILWSSFIFLGTGISFLTLFSIIASKVDIEGVVHEPFFLLPLGYLFVTIGMVNFIVYLFTLKKNK